MLANKSMLQHKFYFKPETSQRYSKLLYIL